MNEADLPFDRIHLGDDDYSVGEFLDVPLLYRVQHIISGTLEFTLAGELVDRNRALVALRLYSAARS
jgi:hypothetical protein